MESKPERITQELRKQAEKYNWDGIEFPTKVEDIHIWEKNNNGINIKKVYAIRLCDVGTSVGTKARRGGYGKSVYRFPNRRSQTGV